MPSKAHAVLTGSSGGMHVDYFKEYVNAAARTGDTSLTSADLKKVALQLDNYTQWRLLTTTPTWKEIMPSSIPSAEKAAANGVAPLDENGKVPLINLPAIAITDTFVVASQNAMLALSTAEVGDVAVRTDTNTSYILKTAGYSTLANWQELLAPVPTNISGNAATATVANRVRTSDPGSYTDGDIWVA